ncbi:carbohydrate-binding protein [Glaciibacter flavus]|uniref:carbohydrate-binding protein n=1 Tax=Orlajensenia flava TaxID=2565934 RepID=UPI003B009463
MRRSLSLVVAAVAASAAVCAALAVPTTAQAADAASVKITEWMYNPVSSSGEYVEFTNLGAAPVSLTGWSFDDDSRTPGTVPLDSLGTLAVGQSAIITESADATFRTEWSLGADVKILAGNTTNLGRADEINLFNGPDAVANLAVRLTYNDQGTGTVRGPRTQGVAGIPKTDAALGANDASQWQLSAVGDAEGSRTSTAGDIGSPGTSRFGAGAPTNPTDPTDPTDPTGPPAPTLNCVPEAPSGTGTLPASALAPAAWPGSASVAVADPQCAWKSITGAEGRDVSGLVFDPSNANVLYSVKNKGWVFRMVKQGDTWVADTSNGWGAGKQIFFPGSTDTQTNLPDSEGLTIGPDGALYVTTERNNAANTIPLNSILRFDPAQAGTQLVATDEWNLTAEFPELHAGNKTEANLGFEGVTFVPDDYLTGNGFVDQSTGKAYKPIDYPKHGTGLYLAALENDGKLYAYALNNDHSFHRVAAVDTGMDHVMDVSFDADTQRIWALCDNTCGVTSTVLKVSATGSIVPDVAYAKPAALPVNNLEGFALAPNSTCVGGTKEVVWSDDGIYGAGPGTASEGHALYSGRIDCDLGLGGQGVPKPAAWNTGTGYASGDLVSYGGSVFRALWYTRGETPASSTYGAWAEIAIASDGSTLWTATGVFTAGDVVVYRGRTFTALWYTRGTAPGGVGGPWSEIVAPTTPGGVPAWSPATVYTGGEKVSYSGHVYQAQWYTVGTAPSHTSPWGVWKLIG